MNGSLRAALAHLDYLQREGTQRDGSRGLAYSAKEDAFEGKSLIARCSDDRHQFRVIVSPEDGDLYEDLKPLVRGFMGEMEKDLGTSLQWAAVNHCDTAHPHSHIILRGRDDLGEDLIIAREYIHHGMAARLTELVTRDLGPRDDLETRHALRQEIESERLTSIDHDLLRSASPNLTLEPGHKDPFLHALRVGRLRKLERLGFAEPLSHGCWRIVPEVEKQLGSLGERGSILRTIEQELEARGLDRPRSDWVVREPSNFSVVGQVIACGPSGELPDRRFLLIDGTDGRIHYIDLGGDDILEQLPTQSIIRVSATGPDDPSFGQQIGESVATNRPEQMSERGCSEAIRVTLLSPIALERLASWNGPTWLDHALARDEPMSLRNSGFGAAVRSALAARRQWLIEEQLADERDGALQFRANAFAKLREREFLSAGASLGTELGKDFVLPEDGAPVTGMFSRQVDLASGRFALLETSRAFTLVPSHPELGREIGREIGGVHDGNWTVGRGRGLAIA